MERSQNRQPNLYKSHTELKARMGEFGGWDMPIQYSGILSEVAAVRNQSGVFDVSHMGRVYLSGPDSHSLMNMLVTSPVRNMDTLQAKYGLICNGNGGVIDDTIYYKTSKDEYLIIPNAGNRSDVISWIQATNSNHFQNSVNILDRTEDTTMLAVQGPQSESILSHLIALHNNQPLSDLGFFRAATGIFEDATLFLGRTGYTGEDGFELIIDNCYAQQLWDSLISNKVAPCGLGSRDVLRLEAALPLYGHELDINTSPVEAALHRFIKKRTSFIGSEVIHKQLERGTNKTLIGLSVDGKSAPRQGYPIIQNGTPIGVITSGSYSPTLDISIALGYVSTVQYIEGVDLELDIRGKILPANLANTPFYKRGA